MRAFLQESYRRVRVLTAKEKYEHPTGAVEGGNITSVERRRADGTHDKEGNRILLIRLKSRKIDTAVRSQTRWKDGTAVLPAALHRVAPHT